MSTPIVFASGRRNSLFGGDDSSSLIAPNLGFGNNFGQNLLNSFPKTARNALPKEAREMMIEPFGGPSSLSGRGVNGDALERALGGLSIRDDGNVSPRHLRFYKSILKLSPSCRCFPRTTAVGAE